MGRKFCKDCVHFAMGRDKALYPSPGQAKTDYRCKAPQLGQHPTMGLQLFDHAPNVRFRSAQCGPAGAWFDPIQTYTP